MASVKATRCEVFGGCVGEIDVSVEVENRGGWLCCGWNYMGFILVGKVPQDWQYRWGWCQVLEEIFASFGVIEELKSSCVCRGLRGIIGKV